MYCTHCVEDHYHSSNTISLGFKGSGFKEKGTFRLLIFVSLWLHWSSCEKVWIIIACLHGLYEWIKKKLP